MPVSLSARATGERGAALIVAIGTLTVLLVIALTFFTSSRFEQETSRNYVASVRAELLVDSATAIAIAFLNHDLAAHPTYTSLDHAWRTYFNGAWAVGKPWLWQLDPFNPRNIGALPFEFGNFRSDPVQFGNLRSVLGGGVPEVRLNLDRQVPLTGEFVVPPNLGDQLYIPRKILRNELGGLGPLVNINNIELPNGFDDDGDGDIDEIEYPFVTAPDDDFVHAIDFGPDLDIFSLKPFAGPVGRIAAEQIDLWADVDNDDDGLRDSMWFPLSADVQFPNDGLDNDLDGFIDGDDPDGDWGIFLYDGRTDGLDNDFNGVVDDALEGFYLTTLILDPAGQPVLDLAEIVARHQFTQPAMNLANLRVDAIDNDMDLVVNNHEDFFRAGLPFGTVRIDSANVLRRQRFDESLPVADFLSINDKNVDVHHIIEPVYYNLSAALAQYANPAGQVVVTSTGEPVTELVARAAVLIKDEASKVNLNATGGYQYADFPLESPLALERSISAGAGTFEYETRIIPNIGVERARGLWDVRMGLPKGGTFDPDGVTPGYAFVDDNSNALWLAMNGLDDDGNGFVDDGFVPFDFLPDGTPLFASKLEGIDEPGEYQFYRPYRNRVAEQDGIDNDDDQVIDEIGEMGDRRYRSRNQTTLADGIGQGIRDRLLNFVTAHSTDKNTRFRHSLDAETPLPGFARAASGLKLDYNRAGAGQIYQMLKEDFGYPPIAPVFGDDNPLMPLFYRSFAAGLRRGDGDRLIPVEYANLDVNGAPQLINRPILYQSDAELRAAQLAVNVKDFRDTNHGRSELTTTINDEWWPSVGPLALRREISYTAAGTEAIRINEIMVRPVRRVEAEAITDLSSPLVDDPNRPFFDPNQFLLTDFDLGDPAFFDDTVWDEPWTGSSTINGTEIGPSSFLLTNLDDVTADNSAVQFRFRASDQLPPGRYYLTFNSTTNGLPSTRTVTGDDQIRFAIKYADVAGGDPTIIDDINNEPDPFDNWLDVEPEWIGSQFGGGPPTGLVFLPSGSTTDLLSSATLPGYAQDGESVGYTVGIPDPAVDGSLELLVALAIDDASPPSQPLGVNFFDFSQEPDHEWVEIINTSDSAVNLSNWQILVKGDANDNGRLPMVIPGDTFIAAGGSLLLGTNKFDNFDPANPLNPLTTSIFGRNAIGLAGSVEGSADFAAFPYFENVTAPPIPFAGSGLTSVFLRDEFNDFIDNDGDGQVDASVSTEDLIQSTQDPFPELLLNPTKPWDRIVQLDTELGQADDVNDLARWVLNGGVFPNYPDFDGLDNDGDNAILSRDFIDNDGDGVIDELFEGLDESWSFVVDCGDPIFFGPGGYDDASLPYWVNPDPTDPTTAIFLCESLQGNLFDHPDWKAFVERRWYPGDNVIIELQDRKGNVVDSVTYNQLDVENRAIDDVVPVPIVGGALVRTQINSQIRGSWPKNTMGIDFYRSLERKHPLYAGDRFGVSNRWEATDGRYDDWAPSTSQFFHFYDENLVNLGPDDSRTTVPALAQVFAHRFSGTPLRPNGPQLALETLADTAFSNFEPVGWRFGWTAVKNNDLTSPADLLLASHFQQDVQFTEFSYQDSALVNSNFFAAIAAAETPIPTPQLVRDVLLGADNTVDRTALIGSGGASSPVELTVGQATVYRTSFKGSTEWVGDDAPEEWGPVFLFEMPPNDPIPGAFLPLDPVDDEFLPFDPPGYQAQYLLQQPALPPTVDVNRWPINQRAMMYVSGNSEGFSLTLQPGIAAQLGTDVLFVWDGEDGLQNGEYEVYVAFNEDLSRIEDHPTLEPDFGQFFVTNALEQDEQVDNTVFVDVEFFTDRDGDRRVWTDVDGSPRRPNRPDTPYNSEFYTQIFDELNRPTVDEPNRFNESFGMVSRVSPGDDGYFHYGTITVQNNHLALYLRNQGQTVRFSRVILAQRNATPGRININTSSTSITDGNVLFNPMMGLPGLIPLDPPGGDYGLVTFTTTAAGEREVRWPPRGPNDDDQDLAFGMSRGIEANRTIHPDGRYYEFPSDLLTRTTDQAPLSFDDLRWKTEGNAPPTPEALFDELASRYSRLANLVTVRSDVFEIFVTVQTGTGVDVDGDGRINYRSDVEFVVTSEKKARTVYER